MLYHHHHHHRAACRHLRDALMMIEMIILRLATFHPRPETGYCGPFSSIFSCVP